jgi:hypothetical protein
MRAATHLIVVTAEGIACTLVEGLHAEPVLLPLREGEAEATWPRCDRRARDPFRYARRRIAKIIDRTATVRAKLVGSLLEDMPKARRLIAAEPRSYAVRRVTPTLAA